MKIRFHPLQRQSPEAVGGYRIDYGSARRQGSWRWYLLLAVVLSPVAAVLINGAANWLALTASGSVAIEQLEVRAAASGMVREIRPRPGAHIASGEPLVVLEDLALEERQAQLAGTSAADPESAGSALEELTLQERVLQHRRQRRATIERLVSTGAATAAELALALAAEDEAEAAVLRVRRSIAPSAGELRRVRLERESVDRQRARLVSRSPVAGSVIERFVSPGQLVSAGEPLLLIGRDATPTVMAFVPPKLAAGLRPGARATIRFPDGHRATARVAAVPRLARRVPVDLVDQFDLRPMSVVLHLQADSPWAPAHRVPGLPVQVRFHYRWEVNRVGAALGELLGSLAR